MVQAFLIKYAEIGIKGKNRYVFEDALVQNIKTAMKRVEGDFAVTKESGRIYVTAKTDYDEEEAVSALQKVFGISGICPVVIVEDTGFEDLAEAVVKYVGETYPDRHKTFKVNARRADVWEKRYPQDTTFIALLDVNQF